MKKYVLGAGLGVVSGFLTGLLNDRQFLYSPLGDRIAAPEIIGPFGWYFAPGLLFAIAILIVEHDTWRKNIFFILASMAAWLVAQESTIALMGIINNWPWAAYLVGGLIGGSIVTGGFCLLHPLGKRWSYGLLAGGMLALLWYSLYTGFTQSASQLSRDAPNSLYLLFILWQAGMAGTLFFLLEQSTTSDKSKA